MPRGRTRVLYVMGHGYSGSTLLTLLLDRDPRIATVGELGIAERAKAETTVDEYLCSCGQPIRRCPFWQAVVAGMAARGFDFDPWDASLELRASGLASDVL